MEKIICNHKGCENFGKYCRISWHDKIVEGKNFVRIARYSPKRTELNKEYAAISRPLWEGKLCEIKSPVCTWFAQGWNHAAGKENKEKLLDMSNGQPACNACNTYIEQHHSFAVDHGFRTKRNTETKRYENTFKRKL